MLNVSRLTFASLSFALLFCVHSAQAAAPSLVGKWKLSTFKCSDGTNLGMMDLTLTLYAGNPAFLSELKVAQLPGCVVTESGKYAATFNEIAMIPTSIHSTPACHQSNSTVPQQTSALYTVTATTLTTQTPVTDTNQSCPQGSMEVATFERQ